MSTIQIRIDEKTKKKANKIFKSLGLDMTSGIKLYLEQVNRRKGLPFLVLTENGMTVEQEQEILKASEEVKMGINVKEFDNVEDLIADLHN